MRSQPSRQGRVAGRPDAARAGQGGRSWPPTRASSRCANSGEGRLRARRNRASTGRTPSTSWAACCPPMPRSPRSRGRSDRRGRHLLHSRSSSSSGSTASGQRRVTSATPPGSVPTFTLSGCATSQTEVAQTLNRLRLMDGVSRRDASELHQGERKRRLQRRRRWRRMRRRRPVLHRRRSPMIRFRPCLKRSCRHARRGKHGSSGMTGRDRIVVIGIVVCSCWAPPGCWSSRPSASRLRR